MKLKIEDITKKGIEKCRIYDNNIFSECSPDVIEFETARGLHGLHYNSAGEDRNLVIVPALGRPVHDQRLCKFFSDIGFNTTTFSYAGSYDSWDAGPFLPSADGKLSIQEDLEEVLDALHPGEPVELLGPCFGGAAALAVAAERQNQVTAVYLFAPFIPGFSSKADEETHNRLLRVGKFEAFAPYRGADRNKWHASVWTPLVNGDASLNVRKAIPRLAMSDAKLYGVACEHDKIISYKTLEDFAAAYLNESAGQTSFFYIYEDAPEGSTHFGHYKLEFAPGVMQSFCEFSGKNDPSRIIALKKAVDIVFSKRAKGRLLTGNAAEERRILADIRRFAEDFYIDDANKLRQIVRAEQSKVQKFALGLVKGIIL